MTAKTEEQTVDRTSVDKPRPRCGDCDCWEETEALEWPAAIGGLTLLLVGQCTLEDKPPQVRGLKPEGVENRWPKTFEHQRCSSFVESTRQERPTSELRKLLSKCADQKAELRQFEDGQYVDFWVVKAGKYLTTLHEEFEQSRRKKRDELYRQLQRELAEARRSAREARAAALARMGWSIERPHEIAEALAARVKELHPNAKASAGTVIDMLKGSPSSKALPQAFAEAVGVPVQTLFPSEADMPSYDAYCDVRYPSRSPFFVADT